MVGKKHRDLVVQRADFTDCPAIICRVNNWREVFGELFVREESVR